MAKRRHRVGLALVALIALATLAACARQQPRRLQVGTHDISLIFPAGWEHLDYGEQHQFRRDLARISLRDIRWFGDDFADAASRALPGLGETSRRSEASRRHLQIDGRQAVIIDTWDRLSHQWPKRYLFVADRGRLLVIYTMMGDFALMEAPLEGLMASLDFADSSAVAVPAGNGETALSLRRDQTE